MTPFAKAESPAAPGPALVIGAAEAEPAAAAGPTISLTGDMAAPIARDFSAGDEFDGDGKFRVVSVNPDGGVELELVDLTAAPAGEESAESALDGYLAKKGGGSSEEDELV